MDELPPPPGDQDELFIDGQDTSLGALVDQMHQNWELGDNAANDDLVVQIRAHIRRQQATTQRCSPVARERTVRIPPWD